MSDGVGLGLGVDSGDGVRAETRALIVDTFGPVAQVVLALDGEVRAAGMNTGRTHSKSLSPLIESVLATAEVPVSALTHLGAVVGPGSFTGLRIGTATIQGLAMVGEQPVFGVSSLAALADGAPELARAAGLAGSGEPGAPSATEGPDAPSVEGASTLTVPLIDARNRRAYYAVFADVPGAAPRRLTEDAVDAYEVILEAVDQYAQAVKRVVFTGPGAAQALADEAVQAWVQAQVAAGTEVVFRAAEAPTAQALARAAGRAIAAGEVHGAEALLPAYLAPTQAERALGMDTQADPPAPFVDGAD